MYLPAASASDTAAFGSRIACTKRSKRYDVSLGPDLASGWNCAVNHGLVLCMIPSFDSSLRLVKSGIQSSGSCEASRA